MICPKVPATQVDSLGPTHLPFAKQKFKWQVLLREVVAMGIDEYDAELHEKTLIEIGYERGFDTGREQAAMNMLNAGDLPVEKISIYSGLTIEQVLTLRDEL